MFGNDMEVLLRVCVFPMCSMEFYENNYFEKLFETNSYKEFTKQYCKENNLQYDLFMYISRRCKIHNVDQLDLLMDKFYGYAVFQKAKKEHNSVNDIYVDTLKKLAKCFVCHRNGNLALKYWESKREESFLLVHIKGLIKLHFEIH